MNSEQFIQAINNVVLNTSVQDVIENLIEPVGVKIPPNQKSMSEFYNKLTGEQKEIINGIIYEAASSAIFGFLCVIDGVRVFEEGTEKGDLELYYVKGNKKVLLNDINQEYLHDIFNS